MQNFPRKKHVFRNLCQSSLTSLDCPPIGKFPAPLSPCSQGRDLNLKGMVTATGFVQGTCTVNPQDPRAKEYDYPLSWESCEVTTWPVQRG